MSTRHIVLSHPVRTAIGAYNGTLKSVPATELGAIVVRETLRRAGFGGDEIGSVVMGNVIQAGNRMNPARRASIGGGLPVSVPAMTVNRVCGSGAQAILTAALEIAAGDSDAAIAGGMENMDRAPYLMVDGRWGYRMGPAQILDSMLTDGLNDAFSGEHSGWHTEDLVTKLQMMRPQRNGDAVIGPFMETTTLEAVVSEMGRLAIQVGEQINLFFPADWPQGLPSRLAFTKLKQRWIATFYPSPGHATPTSDKPDGA